ncbi:sugar ABC transporter permease [Streptomyces sp. NPDC051322]|uniref:carbohydrate ABC transporter permease n=1 Tax=Streptomyces sp. NPDC051322 TaxID=3154645 RepID=UPI00344BCC1C
MAATAQRTPGRSVARRKPRQQLTGYVFILPTVVLFLAFVAWPIVRAIYFSFTSYSGYATPTYVGVDNYTRLAHDPVFRRALLVTIIFTAVTTVLQTVVPMLVAVLVNTAWRRAGALIRTILFLPGVISFVVTGTIWQLIYDPNLGVLNRLLKDIGLNALAGQWLGDPTTVVPAIIVVSLWQSFGLYMLIFVAGLQGINPVLYEAARIDGANGWQRLTKITVPMLRTVTGVVITLNLINGLKTFDLVFVMTQGGPNHASDVLGTYLYSLAFGTLSGSVPQVGYATAVSIVVVVLCVIAVAAQFGVNRRKADA